MCEEVWLRRNFSCEDIVEAISLPVIVQEEECSANTDDYVDRKRHQHEEVFRKMRDEIEKINEFVDNEVEQFIEVAKEECQLIHQEIQKYSLDKVESVEEFISVSDKNKKLTSYLSRIISVLATDLKSFEESRSEDIRKVLWKYKDEAVSIRFISIEDIEKAFEKEIRNINLNMVRAFRRYEDVNVQLQVLGQGIIDEYQNHAKEKSKAVAERQAQYLWKKVMDNQSKKLLNDAIYSLKQEKFRVREDFSDVANSLAKGLSDFAEGLQIPTDYEMRGEFWEQWIETLNTRLASLDVLCKSIEKLLKSAVAAVMETFHYQVNELSQAMGIKLHDHLNEFKNVFDVSNEVEEFRKCQANELNQIQEKWQATVDMLNTNIERSKRFVLDLTAIWTTHLARVSKLHNHIESTLESSYNTSLKKYNEKDTKLKGFVKSVREAKDVNKLNELCETLKVKFQEQFMDLEDSYENQLEVMEEMKRKGVEELINEKQMHINDFLNKKYLKREWFFDEDRTSLSIGSIQLSDSDFKIVTQIDMCNTYMKAVENRTLGMYEMLERYIPHCETSVRGETEDWMNMCIQDIVNNNDKRMNEVNERQIKTLKDIKQIRLAELKIHSRRLVSHINGAKHEFVGLNKWYECVKAKQLELLKEFNEKVASRLSKDSVKGIKNELMELEREWSCLSETLVNNITAGKSLCEKNYVYVKEAGNLFLKTAKSFKNGGNYSPEEIKTLNKELNLLGKFILSQNKTLLKNYDNLAKLISRNVLDSKIQQIHVNVQDSGLQQKIMDTLSILRMRLRTEINAMKSRNKSIEEKISFVGSSRLIDSDSLNIILTLISRTHDFMVFPEGVVSLECTNMGKSVDLPNSSTVNKTQKVGKSVPKQNTQPLFKHTSDNVISDESNFFTLTKGLILKKYYQLLQHIIEKKSMAPPEAVKPKSSDSKQKLAKQNIGSDVETHQITLLQHVLRSYNSECELAWLSQVREFLDQIATFRKIFNAVAELEFTKNHENYMKSLDSIEREYLHSVKKEETKKDADREKVQRSLILPLAHPANHVKLSELQGKAKSLAHLQKNEYETHLTKYKNNLQNKHDSYVKTVKELKDSLKDAQTAVFSEGLCKILTDNSKGIRNVIPYEDELGEETLNANRVYPFSIWADANDLDHDSQTPRSICLILLSTSSNISNDSLSGGTGEASTVNINRVAAEQVKESAQKVQKLYDRSRDSTEVHEQTILNWLKSFERSVKEAKQVYSWPCDG